MEARQIEVVITATSPEGFEESIREGLARATASNFRASGFERLEFGAITSRFGGLRHALITHN